jgi:SAM-dependent methyltransferase
VVDLEVLPWPFEDGSAEEIALVHVLEHLGAARDIFLGIVKELYRVLQPGGALRIHVPHPRSEGFLNDPTHVRPVTPQIMSLFSKAKNREWGEKGWPNTPLGLYLDVDFEIESVNFSLTPRWFERYQRGELAGAAFDEAVESHNNVVDEVRMVLKKVA